MSNNGKYCPEIVDEICSHVASGLSNKDAAILVGINQDTLYQWLKEKSEFSEKLDFALRTGKKVHLENINKHSKKYWGASAWWLERKFPSEWGSKSLVNVALQPFEIERPDGSKDKI